LSSIDLGDNGFDFVGTGFGNKRIGATGASAFADALKVNTSLTSINLFRNDIDADVMWAIIDALEGNLTVTSINLLGNGGEFDYDSDGRCIDSRS
jgi:hypothetical protein